MATTERELSIFGPEYAILLKANKLKPAAEVFRTYTVVEHSGLIDRIARRQVIDRKKAEKLAARFLWESLLRGETIIIDDQTHRKVYALESETRGGKRIKVTQIDRSQGFFAKTLRVNRPLLTTHFWQDQGMEFAVAIHGTVHGKKIEGEGEEILRIASNGPVAPREFTVIIGNNAAFGRIDNSNYFTCSLEYQGGVRWVMREPNGKYTALEFPKSR